MLLNNVLVVGLGLIGGSMAKAFSAHTSLNVFGIDKNEEVLDEAKKFGAISDINRIEECDLIIIALYPKQTVDFLSENKTKIKKGAIVMDCGGVKEYVCKRACEIAKENGFSFIGAHPMAGTEHSGFSYSKDDMFFGASLIFTSEDEETIGILKPLFEKIGFKRFVSTTPKEHDQIIAFTSQLAHVVSNAYVKSETSNKHLGFSAGSYKDLTRVAWLNEQMWTELFLENKENILSEIKTIIKNLSQYEKAIEQEDKTALEELLREGRIQKTKVDKMDGVSHEKI